MKLLDAARSWAPVLFALALSACGGGDEGQEVPVDYLKKYEGTWVEQCASPVRFASDGSTGPGSTRSSIVISAPDSSGKVSITLVVDYFDAQLGCFDMTTPPIATIRTDVPLEGRFSRTAPGSVNGFGANVDYVGVAAYDQDLGASGSVTTVLDGGISNLRVTFADGKTDDTPERFVQGAGELGLFRVSINPGTPSATFEIYLQGDNEPYLLKK